MTEVEVGRHAFGFAQAYALLPEASPSRLEDVPGELGAERIEHVPLEWA